MLRTGNYMATLKSGNNYHSATTGVKYDLNVVDAHETGADNRGS